MAMTTPTYNEIRNRMLADMDASMAADGSTRGVVETAIVTAAAGAFFLLHLALSRVARNTVPSRAEAVFMRLWAAFFGIFPNSPTRHTGTATFPATSGATLPAGTVVRLRNGVAFTVDADVTESGDDEVVANITAVLYGPAGRTLAGAPIFLGSPVLGITTQGVTGDIAGGADTESNPSVLSRLLERLRNPPKGGTEADYKRWVRATPGISVDLGYVWVYNSTSDLNLGPASVKTLFAVTPTVDNSYSPIPSSPEVALVQAYVDPLTPVDVLTYLARAVVAQALNPEIELEPNTPEVRAAVSESLRVMLYEQMAPGGTITLSRLNEAISAAAGETDHVLVSPASNVTGSTSEHVIVLGTPVYSDL